MLEMSWNVVSSSICKGLCTSELCFFDLIRRGCILLKLCLPTPIRFLQVLREIREGDEICKHLFILLNKYFEILKRWGLLSFFSLTILGHISKCVPCSHSIKFSWGYFGTTSFTFFFFRKEHFILEAFKNKITF